jgi:cyclic lactone autoinducer peptide
MIATKGRQVARMVCLFHFYQPVAPKRCSG